MSKLCDTCIYRNNVEQLKPCIIYRDDCELYEKEGEGMNDDLISRQAVLDELNKWEWQELYLPIHFKENIIDVVPSVNPQEPCEDAISRKSIKRKLQEHHDFFVNAYGGFSNLPQNDKSRVDEITNCIAMVVNEPPVTPQPKIGHWIKINSGDKAFPESIVCSVCGGENSYLDFGIGTEPIGKFFVKSKYCPNCGARMVGEEV